MKRKLFLGVLAACSVLALGACKKDKPANPVDTVPAPTIVENKVGNQASANKYTIWVPEAAEQLTLNQLKAFLEANKTTDALFTVEKVSEADAAGNMITDVAGGADMYFFAQDQYARLVEANALGELSKNNTAWVKEQNDNGSVAAVTMGEKIYAFPLTSDNGYFMYYDKRVVKEESIGDLDKIMADVNATGNNTFAMEVETSAWYIASWFFATGCELSFQTDDNGKFVASTDTFDGPKGLIAAKAMKHFYDTLGANHVSSSKCAESFAAAKPAAVVVSGTWDYADAKSLLGDNLGVAPLPSFTVDGQSYHMGSFSGYKLLGVKPQTDQKRSSVLQAAAKYLTSTEGQLERFNAVAWGPSNKAAQQDDAVKAAPALCALIAQQPYAVLQGQIPGAWWDIAKVIGTSVKESNGTDAALQEALNKYKKDFNDSLAYPDGIVAVGSCVPAGWNNAQVTPLSTSFTEGTITLDIEVTAVGDKFRFTENKKWVSDRGYNLIKDDASKALVTCGDDNNIVFNEVGSYTVTYNLATATITVVKK